MILSFGPDDASSPTDCNVSARPRRCRFLRSILVEFAVRHDIGNRGVVQLRAVDAYVTTRPTVN